MKYADSVFRYFDEGSLPILYHDVMAIRMSPLAKMLNDMQNLRHDWNGYGSAAPNEVARNNAARVVKLLEALGMEPESLTPSADEGVGFTFRSEQYYAAIECSNDGQIAALTALNGQPPEAWDVKPAQLRETVERIHGFISQQYSG